MEQYLNVNKKYLNADLKPLEILILSQIEEFAINKKPCLLTNKEFAAMFAVTSPTVDSAIARLEKLQYIKRHTKTVSYHGQATKVRQLVLVEKVASKDFAWSF